MKKFLVLSAVIAVAGLGTGITRRQDATPQVVAAPVETTTTTATAPASQVMSSTTTQKPATKRTTATTTRRVSTPTPAPAVTTSTSRLVTTTTIAAPTTTTTVAGPPPTCTLSQENRAVRLRSNLPDTAYKMIAVWPANPNSMNKVPQQFVRQATTDGTGGDLWDPVPSTSTGGTARISVSFYPAGARSVSGLCSTNFVSN